MLAQQLEYDLIRNIPKQVEKFFELQHFDIEAHLDSPRNKSVLNTNRS